MLMRLSLSMIIAILGMASAYAGCSNYTDGSMNSPAPRAVLCFYSKCERITLSYTCVNAYSAQAEWANGWKLELDPTRKRVYAARAGQIFKNKDAKRLTCREIDQDACP